MAFQSINKIEYSKPGESEEKKEQLSVITNVLNCEGAILYQLLFQVFIGTDVMTRLIPDIIKAVV
jgi:hypothetical protein